jgi:proteasome lid subunit RPN8/RPN11
MVAQAVAELPNECCGLLAGRVEAGGVGRVVRRYPLVNALASPVLFESEPRSLLAAHRDMRENHLDVLAVYHSHPTSEPVPSRTDLARNYWPGTVSLIISLRAEPPQVRGWWLGETDYRDADWDCVD